MNLNAFRTGQPPTTERRTSTPLEIFLSRQRRYLTTDMSDSADEVDARVPEATAHDRAIARKMAAAALGRTPPQRSQKMVEAAVLMGQAAWKAEKSGGVIK
eukprot:GHVU01149760.1.p3 GENE.GHVU01149760.1~~GHVU01149760.1.p3  ORF type:complete len:101 (-),score=12.29 GHVU01149760.1:139-441(-)